MPPEPGGVTRARGRPSQDEVVAFLSEPSSYGSDVSRVERIETHGAIVFLAGDKAYKIKRAVKYPYMDFSTLERRHQACAAELRLNRRTAPTLYLDVRCVTRSGDGLVLGGDGEPVEWVVVMSRFPQDCLLDRMAERHALPPSVILDLAGRVAAFHRDAEGAPANSTFGGIARFGATLRENMDGLASAPPQCFSQERVAGLRATADALLRRTAPLVDVRKQDGCVRLCHGDLHLRNICLLDGRPTLFDAIEFNDALAWIDVLQDTAFLLMDLDHRGLRELANLFLTRYLHGAGDFGGLGTLPLFLLDRATVRAKVAVATAALTADPVELKRLAGEASAYLELAEAYVEPPPAALVAVGGLSGSGKSSLAARLAPGLGPAPGAVHVRSDVLRKRMLGAAETERLPASAYTPEMHDRVFSEMFRVAEEVLAAGHAVILDGVFGRPEQRVAAERLARETGVRFRGLWLEAPTATLLSRVAARSGDASDATPEVVRGQLGQDLGCIAWDRIETNHPLDDLAAGVRQQLIRAGLRLADRA